MYISAMGEFSGASRLVLVLGNFLRKLTVSNKKIQQAQRRYSYILLSNNDPLEKFGIFTMDHNYSLALMINWVAIIGWNKQSSPI